MEEKKQCPYCGEEILSVAKKCKHCGEWLDDSAVKSTQVSSQETIRSLVADDNVKTSNAEVENKIANKESDINIAEEDREFYEKGFISFYNERIWKLYRFKYTGSVSQGEYFKFMSLTFLAVWLFICLFETMGLFLYGAGGDDLIYGSFMRPIYLLVLVVLPAYTCICMTIRRLHDLKLSGWWSILGLIPYVGLFLIGYLMYKPGVAVDPKVKMSQKEKITIIALIVIPFILLCIAAASAESEYYYDDYDYYDY